MNRSPELPSRPIDTADAARALLARTQNATRVALDTEGDGMFRYRTRLCTLQLGFPDEVALIDTLAFDALPILRALLGAEGPEKIVHDASFDARVLFAHGLCLERVFDTAVAARFLGLKGTGLSSLLAAYFEIDLPKHKQQADWGERPLDDEALRYLADDVRHLPALAELLLSKLRALDIEAEVREECAYVLREARAEPREVPPWTRIRGAAQRPAKERARLHALCAEREALAQALDLPPARLVATELVSRLAELGVRPIEELVKRLNTRAAPYAARFHAALERAELRADAPEDEVRALLPRPPSQAELERKKARKKLLTEWRTREAEARGVDPQVVLPGHCLNDIVDLEDNSSEALSAVPGFGACRLERYGARLVTELTRLAVR